MRTHKIALLITVVAALSSAGCSTHRVNLAYVPSGEVQPAGSATASVAVGDFVDSRGEPSRWIGAIRGGFGNSLKTLETVMPVSNLVRDVMLQALTARGLFAEDGQYLITGRIDKLDGDQYVRKGATAELLLSLEDRLTGRELLSRPSSAYQVEGSIVTMRTGVFGSVEELHSLIERVLSEAVDNFLDSMAFREAVQVTAIAGTESATDLTDSTNLSRSIHVGMPLIDLTSVAPRPLRAVDRLDDEGERIGRTFTYDNGDGRLLIVTVEGDVVTSIQLE